MVWGGKYPYGPELGIYGGAMLRAIYPFYNIPTQKKPLVHSITAAAHKDSVFFFSACTANFSKVAMLPHVWYNLEPVFWIFNVSKSYPFLTI